MTRVAIHQPEYFPWPGLLAKAKRADVFVVLDHVQFDRTTLQHRAKVVGANGVHWLTIPFIHRFPQRIDEVAFADDRWRVKHWKALQADYGRAPGWPVAAPVLERFFARRYERVIDVTIASLELLHDVFAVTTPLVRASSLAVGGDKGALVLAICRELGATRYLSGRSGAGYLDGAAFAAHGISIEIQDYTPAPYPRLRAIAAEFERGLSALDAWAHLGGDAAAYLEETR